MIYKLLVQKVPKPLFKNIVANSTSFSQILEKCGLYKSGFHFLLIQDRIRNLKLDISHLKGKGWSKDLKLGNWADEFLNKHLVDNSPKKKLTITSYKLKHKLIRVGVFKYECSNCKGTEWLGNPIPLELEHKDGNKFNNKLENLCLLCPNCHALTDTYRAKNYRRYKD